MAGDGFGRPPALMIRNGENGRIPSRFSKFGRGIGHHFAASVAGSCAVKSRSSLIFRQLRSCLRQRIVVKMRLGEDLGGISGVRHMDMK